MSGGALFDYSYPNLEEAYGKWQDEEMNELYGDLFTGAEFSVRGYGGLAQSLDFYLSGDTSEEDYRDALSRFKRKWIDRSPEDRLKFYEDKLKEAYERYRKELDGEIG